MKVSLNTVKQLANIELPPLDELVRRINERLGGVEATIDLGAKYKDAKIVKVVECEKHPNADKLSLCQIDAGTGELIQVVCGAPNVHANMWAVWLPPESIVPSTFDDEEPFVLGARELRGKMSNGMLASARELGIGEDHDGIVDITEQDLPAGIHLEPGISFAQVFGLDDTIIEIENKMFTHRPDLFGQIGVAREIFAILQEDTATSSGKSFQTPEWLRIYPEFVDADGLELNAFNDTPEYAPRFMAVAMQNTASRQSPLWLRCQLIALGAKPINYIVDLTNYMMLMTAQPVHAYDYDKLQGSTLGVRMARAGETITLLNDKTYELDEGDIVIVDGSGPVGLAGVMGGKESEVTSDTQHIVLEVANFDMYAIRKTSMRHGLFTDAVTRFNKGQSPLQTDYVLHRLVEMIPGEQASAVHDQPMIASRQASVHGVVTVSIDHINSVLGTTLTAEAIARILGRTEFTVVPVHESGALEVTAPYWRTDIEISEDVIEEIGRLYGFDRLPRALPHRSASPAPKNVARQTKQLIQESFVRAGANEVLTYSFVHENILQRAEQDTAQAFRLSNALSPDLQYYRLSVLPSLLDKVHMNIKAGHDEFVLFEMGKGHNKKFHATDDEGLPGELQFVDAVYASKKPQDGAAFYRMRRLLDTLAKDMKSQFVYKPITEQLDYPVTAPFDQERSALIETIDGVFIGMIGELKQSVVRSFKLPEYTAAASLDLAGITAARMNAIHAYRPLSRYPSVSQDVSIRTSSTETYATIFESVMEIVKNAHYEVAVEPVSIYQSDEDTSQKTITLRFTFTSHEATLSDKDVAPIIEQIEQLSQK